jgi:hypothetical protein
VVANLALATVGFAEPVLFGRVIDVLSISATGNVAQWPHVDGPSRPKPNLHTASALSSRADLDAGRPNGG